MKKVLLLSSLAAAAAAVSAQPAQQAPGREMGRVLSATPVMQQVAVPQQVCGTQQVVTEAPRSGAGAVVGALAGGVVGNAIGHGGGRAAATALGLFGGAVLGDRVEGGGYAQVQNVQNCVTQTRYENRTVGYDVAYEYAGRRYTTQMASDPGQWVPVQVGAVADGYGAQTAYGPPPVMEPQPVYGQPTYGSVQPVYPQQAAIVQSGVVVPYGAPPVVYAPAYAPVYAPGYYRPAYTAPVGVSLNLGYSRGYGGHWR